jgi:hypothetical protein
MAEADFLCSSYSLLSDEPLVGTAGQGKVWFLIEYGGFWGRKALEESGIPTQVKAKLTGLLESVPGLRILMIRKPGLDRIPAGAMDALAATAEIHFFAANTQVENPQLSAFRLASYDDLYNMDLERLGRGEIIDSSALTNRKVFLVCTHGRRDRCCARFGTEIYDRLTSLEFEDDPQVEFWQSSHVGGHRFAANVTCFPDGIFYGRVSSKEAPQFVEAYLNGLFYTEKARGRSCYPPVVQAAEIHLRRETGEKRLGSFIMKEVSQVERELWKITFLDRNTHDRHALIIAVETSPVEIYKSCDSTETAPVTHYKMIRREVE